MKYPHYGSNIEKMINETIELKEEDKKDKFTLAIAAYMKMAYRNWNKSNVTDEQILADLEKISGGKLTFDKKGSVQFEVFEGQESYKIEPFVKSNAWGVFKDGVSVFNKGNLIDVYSESGLNEFLIN